RARGASLGSTKARAARSHQGFWARLTNHNIGSTIQNHRDKVWLDHMELKVTDYTIDTDGVATVRFNRPGRGNSWTARMNLEYRWIMATLDDDPAVRVIVLRGAGKQFCVGADFKALNFYAEEERDYMATVDTSAAAQPGHGVRPEYEH